MTVLGLSGHVRDTMALLPMPIVMAMVAGVFLKFGVELFTAMVALPWVVVPMTLAYLIVAARPRLAHWVPPVLGALVVGMLAVLLSGAWPPLTVSHWIVRPSCRPRSSPPRPSSNSSCRWLSPCSSSRTARAALCSPRPVTTRR